MSLSKMLHGSWLGGLLVSVMVIAPAEAEAKDVGGITLDMSLAQAKSILSRQGEVIVTEKAPLTLLERGDYDVTACRDHIIMIGHQLGLGFDKFARMAKWAQDQYGLPSETTTEAIPATATQHTPWYLIRLRWNEVGGNAFILIYFETSSGLAGLATESLIDSDALASVMGSIEATSHVPSARPNVLCGP
jgi:hypothetical protein